MTLFRMTKDELKALLLDAKERHTCWEKENGPDADWADWYAAYMIRVMAHENGVDKREIVADAFRDPPLEPYHLKRSEAELGPILETTFKEAGYVNKPYPDDSSLYDTRNPNVAMNKRGW